jgi:hypothetical protein
LIPSRVCQIEWTSGDTIFVLAVQRDSIQKTTHVNLYALDKANCCATKRGETQIAVTEDNREYTMVDLKPNRDWVTPPETVNSRLFF